MISAFGIGNSSILTLLKEVLTLSDTGIGDSLNSRVDLAQRLSSLGNNAGDESILVQRIARLRGVLAC